MLEIEERFRQYQRAMRHHDVLIHVPEHVRSIEDRFREYQQAMHHFDLLQKSSFDAPTASPALAAANLSRIRHPSGLKDGLVKAATSMQDEAARNVSNWSPPPG